MKSHVIKAVFQNVLCFFLLFLNSSLAFSQDIPSTSEMETLRPQTSRRLRIYDRLFYRLSRLTLDAHQEYAHTEVLMDLAERLERVRRTGRSTDILTPVEMEQFQKNRETLNLLEVQFFDQWQFQAPMSAAIRFQRWWTQRNSPLPEGEDYLVLRDHLQQTVRENLLYKKWGDSLPHEFQITHGPTTWGDLLVRFNDDSRFRDHWLHQFPQTLPLLKDLAEIWSWEDTSVRAIKVYNSQRSDEYWVLERLHRAEIPNRFLLSKDGQFDALMALEFASSVYFNRVASVRTESGAIVYQLEAIEKGRTMELYFDRAQNKIIKRTFPGAELLRKSKVDEFLQRNHVRDGTLSLFLGARTLQFDQIQRLLNVHPELVLAVGQFGFSITGGRAQTVSNRTDTMEEQLIKITATLIDIIRFSQVQDVNMWFQQNTRYVMRAMLSGVGSGGSQPLKNPSAVGDHSEEHFNGAALSCRSLF